MFARKLPLDNTLPLNTKTTHATTSRLRGDAAFTLGAAGSAEVAVSLFAGTEAAVAEG